jgi:hypothetical protein
LYLFDNESNKHGFSLCNLPVGKKTNSYYPDCMFKLEFYILLYG